MDTWTPGCQGEQGDRKGTPVQYDEEVIPRDRVLYGRTLAVALLT